MTSPKRILLLLVFASLIHSLTLAQDKAPANKDSKNVAQTQTAAPVTSTPKPALVFGLAEDTPVRLRLTRTMSSSDAKVNEKVDFEVLEAVKVRDLVVIQQGAMAIATVTEAHPKRRMARGGKLNINIDYVQLVSGEKATLRAVKGATGGGHTGAMTGAIVATGILFFPAAPFFLFMHGKDITIPKGTEITAYIAADTPLDPAKFIKPESNIASVQPASPAASELAVVAIKSVPDGAEITIDGKFVGTTPSSVQLTPGEHAISIGKTGFKSWQRTMNVTLGGALNVEATLEKVP